MLRCVDTQATPMHEERPLNRAQFLRLGVAAAGGAGGRAAPAAAALPGPEPQGDDVGSLSFGAVADLTSLAWYRRALRVRGFSAGERRRLTAAATAKRAHLQRINTALGADALLPGDFAATFPASSLASRGRAIAVGREVEDLLVGVYLNGAAFARDSATRLLIGRLLAYDAQQPAWLRGPNSGPPAALRGPAAAVVARPHRRPGGRGPREPRDARAGRRPPRRARHHSQLHQLLKGPLSETSSRTAARRRDGARGAGCRAGVHRLRRRVAERCVPADQQLAALQLRRLQSAAAPDRARRAGRSLRV